MFYLGENWKKYSKIYQPVCIVDSDKMLSIKLILLDLGQKIKINLVLEQLDTLTILVVLRISNFTT